MTSIIGLLCEDGVVIGSDSSATLGVGPAHRTIEIPTEKLALIGECLIVAGTGQVGMGQRFVDVVTKAWNTRTPADFRRLGPLDMVRKITADALQDFAQTGASRGQYGALLAFPAASQPHVCTFSTQDMQPELMTKSICFCSMGSAEDITDPFLAFVRGVFWPNSLPKLHDGVFSVTWALEHAIEFNPGGVNGPARVAVLEKGAGQRLVARILDDAELDEHRQNIQAAKDALRQYKAGLQPEEAVPPVPQP